MSTVGRVSDKKSDADIEQLGINVIRGLAMDGPQKANSGHSGTAMALAPLAHVLWTRIMHHDPDDPKWPDRDRFVLSCGHACILLYSLCTGLSAFSKGWVDFATYRFITGLGVGACAAMLVFVLLLAEGLAWAWAKGVLTWA